MQEEFKKIIQIIKHKKHIKRDELCQTDIPISTYHRWLNQSNINLNGLIKLINRLNLNWHEFALLFQCDKQKKWQRLHREIILAFKSHNFKKLITLQNECLQNQTNYNNDKFLHLNNLIMIFLAYLKPQDLDFDFENLPLIKYLLKSELYTSYEFSYLNYIIVILPFDISLQLYRHIQKHTKYPKENSQYFHDYLRLDINFIFTSIYHCKFKLAKLTIDHISKFHLQEVYLFDRLTIKFLSTANLYLDEPNAANLSSLNKQLALIKALNCPNLYNSLKQLSTFLIANFDNKKA